MSMFKNFLGFGQSATIEVTLSNLTNRKIVEVKSDQQQTCRLPVFHNGESISGKVTISLKRGSKLEYQGIKIELIGNIDFYADRGSRDEFLNRTQDLARPGILSQTSTTYPFHFDNVEMPYESYSGSNVQLRYFLRVTVVKRFMDITKELDLLVHSFYKPQQPDTNIQMEVGIEDSLHIEFEYNKSCYHLEDMIVGKIYFQLVRVKIKHMEVQILRRESTGCLLGGGGGGPGGVGAAFTEMETLAKFEIMDGAPVRGESIPFRLFLGAYDLAPTARDVNRKFSVRYYLNLVLLDEEERRYYKQHEIFLYRRPDKRFEALMQSEQAAAFAQKVQASQNPVPAPLVTNKSTPRSFVSGPATDAPSEGTAVVNATPIVAATAGDAPTPEAQGDQKYHGEAAQVANETSTSAHVGSHGDANGVDKLKTNNGSPSEDKGLHVHELASSLPEIENGSNEAKHASKEEEEEEEEKDVFDGLSDQEEEGECLSREQRSFARYESTREAAERCESEQGAAEQSSTVPEPFDSAPAPAVS